jgi:polar amino acid transport system substrate-binding protein
MNRRPALACLAIALMGLTVAACADSSPAKPKSMSSLSSDPQLHNALPSAIRARGVLRIVTEASYAPASSYAPDGHTIIGFEPDLGVALGELLGVKVVFLNRAFTTLPALVGSHRADLVMSAMTDTLDREKKLDFVDYFSAGSAIVVQRGNPAGLGDLSSLCGHVVALQSGTVQVDLVARAQRNCDGRPITVHFFKTNTDALVELRTGRADAILNDYPPAAALVTDSRTSAYYQLASTAQYEPGPYGIGVAKDEPQLRETIARALGRLIKDGRYRAILRKWGVSAGAVTEVTSNAGEHQ